MKVDLVQVKKPLIYEYDSLVSCVCVTYNRPTLLNELLYCFLQQDYENKELIIVNDQKNIDYYYDDSRVKIFNFKERFSSLGAKRNFAHAKVSGKFVFTMDDDDIFYSNHISKLIRFHIAHINDDIVFNRYYFISVDNENVETKINHLALNGSSIKIGYVNNHSFPEISCGEDIVFIKDAKVSRIDDTQSTFHYRMGMNTPHVSEKDGNGSIMYKNMASDDAQNKFIKLVPELSLETKKYYR